MGIMNLCCVKRVRMYLSFSTHPIGKPLNLACMGYGVICIRHLIMSDFAKAMRNCPHRWLITYDDSPYIRELFEFANIVEWELQYGMNNYKQGKADKGKELFIKNY